jgi:hypothetical protein
VSTAVMMQRTGETSPRLKARITGVFYLLTITSEVWDIYRTEPRLLKGHQLGFCPGSDVLRQRSVAETRGHLLPVRESPT